VDLTAATATVLTLAVWAAGYAAACAFWPFTACRRCRGAGKLRSPFGRAFRLCPRCKASGRRLRFGRRLFTHVTRGGR
jgi:hypothetical protein